MSKKISDEIRQEIILKNIPQALAGDNEAFIQILNASRPTIDVILKKYIDHELSKELIKDLRQECEVHIWTKVIPDYKLSKTTKFTTYLYQQLRGYIQTVYPKKYKMISFTPDFKKEAKKIRDKPKKKRTEKEKEKLERFDLVNHNNFFLYDNKENMESSYSIKEDKKLLMISLHDIAKKKLSTKEHEIFNLILKDYTNSDISSVLAVSRQYVNKVYTNIVNKLKNSTLLTEN